MRLGVGCVGGGVCGRWGEGGVKIHDGERSEMFCNRLIRREFNKAIGYIHNSTTSPNRKVHSFGYYQHRGQDILRKLVSLDYRESQCPSHHHLQLLEFNESA